MQHARPDYQQHIQDNRTNGQSENGIPADEPVMLFRAQDILAASVLRFYVFKLLQHGADPCMAQQVMAQADAMDAWHHHKTPDAPAARGEESPQNPTPRTQNPDLLASLHHTIDRVLQDYQRGAITADFGLATINEIIRLSPPPAGEDWGPPPEEEPKP